MRFREPFGFLNYNRLRIGSACVLSDSGTIWEGSTILGFPAVTLRSSIERPEPLDTGSITMTGLDPETLIAAIRFAIVREALPQGPSNSQIENTSERAVNFTLSTACQHDFWNVLRQRFATHSPGAPTHASRRHCALGP